MGRAGVAGSGSRVGKNEENWNTSGNYVDYIPKLVTASTPTGNQYREQIFCSFMTRTCSPVLRLRNLNTLSPLPPLPTYPKCSHAAKKSPEKIPSEVRHSPMLDVLGSPPGSRLPCSWFLGSWLPDALVTASSESGVSTEESCRCCLEMWTKFRESSQKIQRRNQLRATSMLKAPASA